MWYHAAMADYGRMHELGESLRRQLASARQVRIRSSEGTELAFTIDKPPVVDAGPTRSAPRKHTFLPAGIVAVVPVEASVEGVVKVARDQCDSMVLNEVIEIRKGAPVRVEAATQQECVRQMLTSKDRVGFVTIGLNPAMKPSENNGAYFANDRGAGLVTVNFGDNRTFGGSSPGGEWYVVLAGATLEADGKVIVRDGRILEGGERSASTSRTSR